VIGDVTDKGMPAALVMATTCTMLRAAAHETSSPGDVLGKVNNLLCSSIPTGMFVTCFYAILDPSSGRLRFANAGHDIPYHRQDGIVSELRAVGMPLGLMPGEHYAEQNATIELGESILFYTDGLVEAHSPHGDMFGFDHVKQMVRNSDSKTTLIDDLLSELHAFTGERWEQEDDVTLIILQRGL
jgi:serine phosphatase RsbU (regulator of sigma subunit)